MITKPNPDVCRNCAKVADCDCLCHISDVFTSPHDKIYGVLGEDREMIATIRAREDARWGHGKTEKDWLD